MIFSADGRFNRKSLTKWELLLAVNFIIKARRWLAMHYAYLAKCRRFFQALESDPNVRPGESSVFSFELHMIRGRYEYPGGPGLQESLR